MQLEYWVDDYVIAWTNIIVLIKHQGPLLLIWINYNTSMDE